MNYVFLLIVLLNNFVSIDLYMLSVKKFVLWNYCITCNKELLWVNFAAGYIKLYTCLQSSVKLF